MTERRTLFTKLFFLMLECMTILIVVFFTKIMSDYVLLIRDEVGIKEISIAIAIMYVLGLVWLWNPVSMYFFHKRAAMNKGRNESEKRLLNTVRDISANAASVALKKPPKFKLYWVGDPSINAQALGKRRIAVTAGAINALEQRYLIAMLLHEINHLVHGHSLFLISVKASYFSLVFGVTLSWTIMIINYLPYLDILNFLFLVRLALGFILTSVILRVTRILLYSIAKVMLRQFEYESDEFAVKCGYGKEMWSILDFFAKRQEKIKWYQVIKKLNATHPDAEKRRNRVAALTKKRGQWF